MKKALSIVSILTIILFTTKTFAQKTIQSATLEYTITTIDTQDSSFNMTSHEKYYYATDMLRIDTWYDDGSSETYYNGKKNTITSLESGGGESLYYIYTPELWKKESLTYVSKFEPLPEQVTIQGYKCKTAKIYFQHTDGFQKIYYTADFIPQTEKNTTTKQSIPGFIIQKKTYNKKNQIIQTGILKTFKQNPLPEKTFIPNTKNYTKQDLYKEEE